MHLNLLLFNSSFNRKPVYIFAVGVYQVSEHKLYLIYPKRCFYFGISLERKIFLCGAFKSNSIVNYLHLDEDAPAVAHLQYQYK